MALDRISEEISHFVGLFQLEVEAAKLRLEYQEFRMLRDDAALDPLREEAYAGDHNLEKRDIKTGLPNPKFAPIPTDDGWQALPMDIAPEAPMIESVIYIDPTPFENPAVGGVNVTLNGPQFEIMPNSIVAVIAQSAFLDDNDLLIFDGSGDFVDPGVYLTLLMDLGEVAQSLHLIDPWIWSSADDANYAAVKSTVDAFNAMTLPQQEGVNAVLLRSDEAQGIFVNGQAAEALPEVEDLLPLFLQPEEVDEAPEVKSDFPAEDITIPDVSGYGVAPGHHVVTGGNRAINDTVIKSVWVDAPVIAVAQNVLSLDVISQVNLRKDSSDISSQATHVPSVSINAAQMEHMPEMPKSGADASGAADSLDALPSFWNVTHLDGDLVLMNWVTQHIFVTDYDRVEVQFTGAATSIGTGENLVFNETLIQNFGFHYDLIMVGGDMITLNQISQTNVLLDQSKVTGDVPEGASLHAGDNLQLNLASIKTTGTDHLTGQRDDFKEAFESLKAGKQADLAEVAQNQKFAGKEALSVLYVEKNLIQSNVIEQINYLGDSDQIHFIKDMFSTAAGADISVTAGSNAQINAAHITATGLDSVITAGGEAYSDAFIYQAELIDEEAAPTGVHMSALASEAVAFLADGMIPPAPEEQKAAPTDTYDSPACVDIMQAMLA